MASAAGRSTRPGRSCRNSSPRTSATGSRTQAVTRVGDEWLIAYTGFSRSGPLVCLAATRDFRTYERRGDDLRTRGQGRGALPGADRRALRHDPPSCRGSRAERRHLASVEPRPRAHWQGTFCPARARGGLSGTAPRSGSALRPSSPRPAGSSSYHGVKDTAVGAIYRLGSHCSRPRIPSASRHGRMSGCVRAGGAAVRALRRRRQRRLSVRLAAARRRGHDPCLLRRSRHEPVRRDSKPSQLLAQLTRQVETTGEPSR